MRISTAAYLAIVLAFARKILRKIVPSKPAANGRIVKALVPLRDTCYGTLSSGYSSMYVMHYMSEHFRMAGPAPLVHEYTVFTAVFGNCEDLAEYALDNRLEVLPVAWRDGHRHITGDPLHVSKIVETLESPLSSMMEQDSVDAASKIISIASRLLGERRKENTV